MIKLTFSVICLFLILIACNNPKEKIQSKKETAEINMTGENFKNTVEKIRTSDIYENPKNWEARGLNPSGQSVIITLRKATNNFLEKLVEIVSSNVSSETKHKQVSNLVDELPWDELDTEEKEFMADILSPAVKAAGFDPSTMF